MTTLHKASSTTGDQACRLLLACFLFALFLSLAAQTPKPDHWSDWDWGDAQTLLTLNQWQKQGWLHNYLLFKPQGYAPMVDLLDQEGLRQHAHGISPEASPRVGPRLWYTHYPPGYLIPYALLTRLDLGSRQQLQLFSITLSLAGLLCMYLVFARITSPVVALAAVLFYGTSSLFTGYADSLANHPLDDLFRFAFMLAVVLSTRAAANRNRWLALAWILEFLLSLCSFDSVFFVYLWLVGWDLLEGKGLRWRKWLLFALAPLSAHGLQFLQNVWYLGWHDAFLDIAGTYQARHSVIDGTGGLAGHLGSILSAIQFIFFAFDVTGFGLPLLLILYLLGRRLDPGTQAAFPSFRLLLLLLLCGLAFALVLPRAAMMDYQERQMVPFAAMLAGGVTGALVHLLVPWHHPAGQNMKGVAGPIGRYRTLCMGLTGLSVAMLVAGTHYTRHRLPPAITKLDLTSGIYADHLFARELQNLQTDSPPIYFLQGKGMALLNPFYMPGYPQIHPIMEYYAGSRLILCFDNPALLVRDMGTLLDRSPHRFSPVLIADQPELISAAVSLLTKEGRMTAAPTEMMRNWNLFVLDLTPFLQWNPTGLAP